MKIIKHGAEARQLLKNGIDKVADAVKLTLGPSGRNAILSRGYANPLITNDGVSIAQQVVCDNEIEELGAQMVKEVSKITDQRAGDGTTTATVLLQAITNEGFKRLGDNKSLLKSTVDTMEIKRDIDDACEAVMTELDKVSRKITKREDIFHVAKVSVEDDKLATIITELYQSVGKDGTVTVEDGYFEIESDVVNGLEIEASYQSPHMATNDKRECIINKPHILITNYKIDSHVPLIPLIEKLNNEGVRELVIIADDFGRDVISAFVVNKESGAFTVIAVKAPFFNRKELYEDVAILTGGTFLDADSRIPITSLEVKDLGKADKVFIKDKTLIIGGKGETKDRVKLLKSELKDTVSLFDKAKLEKRIAGLSGGMGVIRVGAQSESEREYIKLKIEDAVNAVKYALQDGVVKGGGITLKQIAEKLPVNILTEALKAPYLQIMKNAGRELEISDDIIDPVRTTKAAVKNACSIAGVLLTTEVAIAEKEEEDCCHGRQNKG